ncbi:uncharacterized protein LOC114741327 [Neltuma alba]|uniref:uncharacterized protein LOC114741327 n=1 Tax=Neltuma alba TaxID=207710 RepID=UPI0010A3EA7E|nr:uncharacterized protein LOC114741327 [Prosopis alba]
MDQIRYWNIRGACGQGLNKNLRAIFGNLTLTVLILSETKCESDSKLRCIYSLGFDSLFSIPSTGHSRGLAVAWKSDLVRISILSSNKQLLHLRCEFLGKPACLLTAIYAIPHSNLRQTLWEDLKFLAQSTAEPWGVIRDFNDIAEASERVGGGRVNSKRIRWFNDQLKDCGLTDLGFNDPKFTWKGPKLKGCSRMYRRLDRALGNALFMSTFHNYLIKVCSCTKFFDHNPLMLCLDAENLRFRGTKPFRFKAIWIEHENFQSFMEKSWMLDEDINKSLSNFKNSILIWNREVFGFIEKKKKNILARLAGIQKAEAYLYSSFLSDLEIKLQSELEEVLNLEEIKWFQKSRSEWITKGDRNTRYYHLKTHRRRKWNKILSLKDEQGT